MSEATGETTQDIVVCRQLIGFWFGMMRKAN